MQKIQTFAIRSGRSRVRSAFTLMETVIAIGVLAVLLTGFIAVFTPAAQGIRRSISTQQADRLTTTLERELVIVRTGQITPEPATGFDKGFTWIKEGNVASNAIFVYQYRGNPSVLRTNDGSPTPVTTITGQPGKDYIIQTVARRVGEANFKDDLNAIEGAIFYVKPTQLIFSGNQMVLGTPGVIANPAGSTPATATSSAAYTDAVIAFSAEFYSVPTKAFAFLSGTKFKERFDSTSTKPIFTRNLAIRR